MAIVVLMSILNVIIARKLQLAKKNRRRLTLKSALGTDKKEMALFKSFTEKKLTALMLTICVIYLFGNLPQAIVMVLHSDSMEPKYGFQVRSDYFLISAIHGPMRQSATNILMYTLK